MPARKPVSIARKPSHPVARLPGLRSQTSTLRPQGSRSKTQGATPARKPPDLRASLGPLRWQAFALHSQGSEPCGRPSKPCGPSREPCARGGRRGACGPDPQPPPIACQEWSNQAHTRAATARTRNFFGRRPAQTPDDRGATPQTPPFALHDRRPQRRRPGLRGSLSRPHRFQTAVDLIRPGPEHRRQRAMPRLLVRTGGGAGDVAGSSVRAALSN